MQILQVIRYRLIVRISSEASGVASRCLNDDDDNDYVVRSIQQLLMESTFLSISLIAIKRATVYISPNWKASSQGPWRRKTTDR